jgi:hypothetical protein
MPDNKKLLLTLKRRIEVLPFLKNHLSLLNIVSNKVQREMEKRTALWVVF